MNTKPLSIIILLRNGETTIKLTLNSLESQENKELIKEIIVINDFSIDSSLQIVNKHLKKSKFIWRIVNHKRSKGIAYCNNEAIRLVRTKYYLIMPQDITLTSKKAFAKSLIPLLNSDNVVASYSIIRHPILQWKKYNFWLKCLFSRHLNKDIKGFGKFDCFNKQLLIKKVGLYDENRFKTGGEDGDIYFRIIKKNLLTTSSFNIVNHIHSNDPKFSLKQLFIKENQMAEANGVVLRKHGIITVPIFILMFFRPILVIILLIPYVNILAVILILSYSFLYTKQVYLLEFRNPKIVFLPLINISMLFTSSFFSIKGLFNGKQK